jgi:hypothetical protein
MNFRWRRTFAAICVGILDAVLFVALMLFGQGLADTAKPVNAEARALESFTAKRFDDGLSAMRPHHTVWPSIPFPP